MMCTSGFERANFLVVFTFKIEIDFGIGAARVSRGGGDGVECLACQQRGAVDVWFDQFVGCADVFRG